MYQLVISLIYFFNIYVKLIFLKMKHIKTFEAVNKETIKKAVGMQSSFLNSNILKVINKWGSVIDNIIHFDFKLIPYEFNNRETFNKITTLIIELSKIKTIIAGIKKIKTPEMEAEFSNDNPVKEINFEDFEYYGIDHKIADILEDEEVLEYLMNDPKLARRLQSMDELVQIFEDYKEWYLENKGE
jgi:hypothetical protein